MIQPLFSDSSESNTYVVSGELTCVIDPGITANKCLNLIRGNNMSAKVLINTHCHFDHVGANLKLLSAKDMRCFCHSEDANSLEDGDDMMQLASLFGMQPVKHNVDVKVEDGHKIDLGGVVLEVIYTPGHTPGSICLYEPKTKSLFTGDTVFVGSIGRYDFNGGDYDKLCESVAKLGKLVEKRGVEKIYPGHGPIGVGEDIVSVYNAFF